METIQTMTQLSSREVFDLAKNNDRLIIESLGLGYEQLSNGCACPIHGGDNRKGFSYSKDLKIWQCWTQGCHEELTGSIVGLVQGVLNISREEALDYIVKVCQGKGGNWNVAPFAPPPEEEGYRTFSDEEIDQMDHKVQYFLDRGFEAKTLETFKTFYDDSTKRSLRGRACIPLFDEDNLLVGFTGRTTTGHEIKWCHQPRKVPCGKILFGLNITKPYIKEAGFTYLTESPLDCMKLYEAGYKNCVSIFGGNFSKHQKELLVKNKCFSIHTIFDPDKAGFKCEQKLINKYSIYFKITPLSDKFTKDISDYSVEEIQKILQ